MNKKKNTLGTLILCILVLIIGVVIGIFGSNLFEKDIEDINSSSNMENNSDILKENIVIMDDNNKQLVLALGRYLYFLADAYTKNCENSYFEEMDSSEFGHTYVSNYGEILDSFTKKYKSENPRGTCAKKVEGNKYDLNDCWCGLGGPLGVETIFIREFKVLEASEKEIKYSVKVVQWADDDADIGFSVKDEEYNDIFVIKYEDGMWKVDEFTFRYILDVN